MRDCRHGLSSHLELFNLTHRKAGYDEVRPRQRQRQDRNFEIVVNHITTNEDQLLQVSRQSLVALKDVFGHNIKKYSGTLHHKPGNEHVHLLVMSEVPKTESAVKARIAASMALIFGTETGSVEVKNPEHRTVEFMCGGEWEISHGGARTGAGRQGPVQVLTAAIKAATPELQCKTYEEFKRLLASAAESVGCTTSALPRVLAENSFGKVPMRKDGKLIRNPGYDEKEFNALPKEQQTDQRKRSMKYLQGPNGSLREEPLVVAHEF